MADFQELNSSDSTRPLKRKIYTHFTRRRIKQFLEELERTGNVSAACSAACIHRTTAYIRREADPVFAAKWDEAMEMAVDAMELEARRRAVEGVSEPVFYQGMECGTIQRYSDALLTFLLRGHRPMKYRDVIQQNINQNVTSGQVNIYIPDNGRENNDGSSQPG